MARLKIVTANICGLNDIKKRQKVAMGLQVMGANIICLQETHIEGSQQYLLKTLGYRLIIASTQGVRARGVAILAKGGDLQFTRTLADKFGRWAITECHYDNGESKLTLCTIYGNVSDDPEVLSGVANELAHWPLPLIVCGDFNLHLPGEWLSDPDFKYQGRKPKVFQALKDMCMLHGLIDGWQLEHSGDPGFTYYSYPHSRHARLDYMLMSSFLSPACIIEKLPRVLSDHNPLVLNLECGINKLNMRTWTFERALLGNEKFCQHMRSWILGFLEDNLGSAAIDVVWDALKAGIRGETLQFSLSSNKEAKQKMATLQYNLGRAEGDLIKSVQEGRAPDSELNRVAIAKNYIIDILMEKAVAKATTYKEKIYEVNEQMGHQLAVRTREEYSANIIKEIRDPESGLKTESSEIRATFHRFYQNLYETAEIQQGRPEADLNLNAPVRFEKEDQESLDNPPYWEEILLSINSLAAGKAAGMDGIPTEFYVKFSSQLKEIIQELFVHIFQGGRPPASWSSAKIVVFVKKNKDPLEPGSYRPITLINGDSKI